MLTSHSPRHTVLVSHFPNFRLAVVGEGDPVPAAKGQGRQDQDQGLHPHRHTLTGSFQGGIGGQAVREISLLTTHLTQAIDRNKDGFITRGELKLAKKNVGMDAINECIRVNDTNRDGKLNMREFEDSGSAASTHHKRK